MPRNDDISLILAKAKLNGMFPDVGNHETDVLESIAKGMLSDDSGFGAAYAKYSEGAARSLGMAIVTDTQWAGGMSTASADNKPAFLAAMASSAKTIYIPEGIYPVTGSLDITAYSGKRVTGSGKNSVLKFNTGLTTAAILGTSSGVTDFTIDNIELDLQWVAGQPVAHAIQITKGARIAVDRVSIKTCGGNGILFQGLSTVNGTVDSSVTNCIIDGTGLFDSSTGFGIHVKDASINALVKNNRLKNIKGGMGIGLSGSPATGYPKHCIITGNHITMSASTIGFESIGITDGCDFNVISFNNSPQSYDNGYSITGSYNTVIGNIIGTCWNHGIAVGGDGNTVTGNNIRNIGRQDAQPYGGVSIDTGAYNTVVGNFIFDDNADASPFRMSYKVKFVASGGNNYVGPNPGYGQTVAEYTPVNSGRVSTDVVVSTFGVGNQFEELTLTGATATARVLRFKTDALDRFAWVLNSTAESGANAGSDFDLNVYADNGTYIGTALSVTRSNRVVKVTKGLALTTKAGIPTDADYTTAPPDGTSVLDTTNHRIYIRSAGVWKYTALT